MIQTDSCTFCSVWNLAQFLTSPYNNFQVANLNKYTSIDKVAKQDFCPKICFDLIPGNSDAFSTEIKTHSRHFGGVSLLNITTNCDFNASAANAITYKDYVKWLIPGTRWLMNYLQRMVRNMDNLHHQTNWRKDCNLQWNWKCICHYQDWQKEVHGMLEVQNACTSSHGNGIANIRSPSFYQKPQKGIPMDKSAHWKTC